MGKMPRIPGLRRVFRFPARSARQLDADLDDELRFHLEMRADELMATGLTRDAARAEALRQFGDLAYTKQYCRGLDARRERTARRLELFEEIRQDARYAMRQLVKAPVFTLVAVLTLALGIGANTAIFSVVEGVVLRPLPYVDAERLVRIHLDRAGHHVPLSPLDLQAFRQGSHSFETIAATLEATATLTGGDLAPERLRRAIVSTSLFAVLGAQPLVGHTLPPSDDIGVAPHTVVLSEALWRRRFGGDPKVAGSTITLDGEPYIVAGVVPREVEYPAAVDIWTPLGLDAGLLDPRARSARFLKVLGRLRPGVPVERARAELSAIAARLADEYPRSNAELGIDLVGLREQLVGDVRTPLLILLGAVGFVMLIACTNVANLLFVRAAGRRTEIAIRIALGAGRTRLLRQHITESMLLAALGGGVGVALAIWGTDRLVALAPERIPRMQGVGVAGPALLFTAVVVLVTGVLFGLVPALHASEPGLSGTLKGGTAGSRMRQGGRRAREVLIVAEMALSLMLLAGAGLLIRSFSRLQRVDPGFRAEQAASFRVSLPAARYPGEARRRQFAAALLEELRQMPGVQSAGLVSGLPLSGSSFILNFDVDRRPPSAPGQQPQAQMRTASAGYFTAMGIPLLHGRAFTDADRSGHAPVAVISQEAAHRYFPDEDPIGRTIRFGYDVPLFGEIVGVVGNTRQYGLDADPPPEAYLANDQYPSAELMVVLRSARPVAAVIAGARARLRELDRDLPLEAPKALRELVAESVSQPRFYMMLLGAFAAVALLLSAVGIYGVISYAVSQRSREIGIRMALGATGDEVLRMVVRQGLLLALLGAGAGIVGGLWVTRLMASLLFGVSPADPATFVGVALLLIAVAWLACYLPARRASGVDPLVALRAE